MKLKAKKPHSPLKKGNLKIKNLSVFHYTFLAYNLCFY